MSFPPPWSDYGMHKTQAMMNSEDSGIGSMSSRTSGQNSNGYPDSVSSSRRSSLSSVRSDDSTVTLRSDVSALIQIQVQDFNGKTHMVNLRRTDKVRDLRVKIEEKLKSTMSIASCQTLQFYMNFQGKCLDDKLTLSLESLGMQNLSNIFVQGRLLGGALCK